MTTAREMGSRLDNQCNDQRMKRVAAVGISLVATLLLAGCTSDDVAPPSRAASPVVSVDPSSLTVAVRENAWQDPATGITIAPASCIAAVRWHDHLYVVGIKTTTPALQTPQPTLPLEGVVIPGCNDTGGTSEPDHPVKAWAIEGIDSSVAVLVDYP